jgi:signal transduction histidine kinase/CheY-like chemotaxis protein
MALVVIFSTGATYWAGLRLVRLRALAAPHRDVIVQAERLLSTLKDAETGQRGFVITGDGRYLDPYESARSRLQGEIDRLRDLKNVTVPIRELDAIQALVQTKLDELGETIALRRSGGFAAAAARVQEGAGKETMDELRKRISAVRDQQETLIQTEGRQIESATALRTLVFLVCGLVNLFFIVWAYRRIRLALDEREAANAAKDHFLAMLSHELRTPLSPVLATLNLWEVSDELPSGMKSDVQMLRRSVELEARIIDDLLDLTRIAKGILSFTRETIDLHELIEFLVSLCHSEFRDKQVALSVALEAERHYLHTDAGRLQQILWNVIKNAAKFTEPGGEVRLATSNGTGGNVVITVTDNGIGMTPETVGRLFKPFEQGEKVISRRYGGLGLGMAISSALAGQLGGELTAKSDGLGQGSSFTIIFPSTDAVPARLDGNVKRDPSPAGINILLVEDHYDSALALTQLLSKQGYVVRTANTVASALEAVAERTFDVLICDIGLPDGTGFQLIETVRKKATTPAIALSGFGMEEDVAQSQLSGFDAHLTKPVNFHNLQAAIRKLTARP